MAVAIAAMSGVPVTLQAAGSTSGNGSIVAPPPSFRNHTFYLICSSGTFSTGAVQVESTDNVNDANTWAPQGSAVTLVTSSTLMVTLTGLFSFLRARISTAITGGGTVQVDYVGAKSY